MSSQNVSSTVVSVFSESPISVIQNESGEFVLHGKNEFLEKLESAKGFVESYVFETDDDRKSARSAKAEMNKLDKQVKAELKKAEANIFAGVRADVSEINSAVGELVTLLSDQINFFDNKYKEEKMEQIQTAFDSALLSTCPEIREALTLQNVLDSRWLNRTTTVSKIVEGLDSRLQTLDAVTGMMDGSVDDALFLLRSVAWDSSKAMVKIHRQQVEAEEKARALEEEKALAQSAQSSTVESEDESRIARVTVPVSELMKFRRVMNANGWDFEYEAQE